MWTFIIWPLGSVKCSRVHGEKHLLTWSHLHSLGYSGWAAIIPLCLLLLVCVGWRVVHFWPFCTGAQTTSGQSSPCVAWLAFVLLPSLLHPGFPLLSVLISNVFHPCESPWSCLRGVLSSQMLCVLSQEAPEKAKITKEWNVCSLKWPIFVLSFGRM